MSQNLGFTLIESLMVIVIVAILAGVALPQFVNFSSDAKIAVTTERLNALKIGIMGDPRLVASGQYLAPGFYAHIGSLPASLTDLITQGAYANYNPFTKRGWRGPYVSSASTTWNLDAWSVAIVYSAGGRTLKSNGPDGVAGNADDITVNF